MPYKAQKPCSYNGCTKLTKERYCEEHKKQEAKHYNQFDRDPESNKRYGRRWKNIRASFLSANPLCEICRKEGKLISAIVVHHKKSLNDGGTHDLENLQALCTYCHEKIHNGQGQRWNKGIN